MGHLVRRGWRKTVRGIPNVASRRRRSSVATTPEVEGITENFNRLSGCPFHHGGKRLSAAAAEIAKIKFHPLIGEPDSTTEDQTDVKAIKSFDEIPSPKRLSLFRTFMRMFSSGEHLHKQCDKLHKELGPIFKNKLGTEDCVIISGKEYIDTVFQSEGKYPRHMVPEAWRIYNEETRTERGIFFMNGEEWYNIRKLLNEALMSQKAVAEYYGAFEEVSVDLVKRWDYLFKNDGTDDGVLKDLETELYNWSVEAMATMLFGRRLGCMQLSDEDGSPKHHAFVARVREIFEQSARMTMIPPMVARNLNLPAWRAFSEAATEALKLARDYVIERMEEIKYLQGQGQSVDGVLARLMAIPGITANEIISIIADLIIAAADTTSHAAQWSIHELAKNPHCQEKLLAQIKAAVKPGEIIRGEDLAKIPYAMHIVKEALRLYPVASFLSRTLDKDVVLGGYHVPAEKLIVMSQYTIGRDPVNFPNPEIFMPERWDGREQKEKNPGSKICTPFGVGARSCVGKRVAEIKAPLMLCNIIQKFRLESANETEVDSILRMITAPSTPIKIGLHPRDN